MKQTDSLLARLEGVKRTGQGKWVALCPAHGDKHPSLAVRETDDGVLLIHCFAGCDAEAVLGALGLDLSDLFPPKGSDGRKPDKRPFSAADLIHLAAWESLIAAIVTSDITRGKTADRDRLLVCAARLRHIAEVAGVR